MTPLLSIERLSVLYPGRGGDVLAVRDVSLRLMPGEALGLVGESGCGKSTLAGAVLGAVPGRGRITAGSILFDGTDIAAMPPAALRRMRGGDIGLVSQDAMSALNPAFRIGDQLIETLRCHRRMTRTAARDAAMDMLNEVGLPDPVRIMDAFPHRLSGGQQQRVVIAMALLPQPRLLLLDEPTTALDVTVEAGIIDLLRRLCAAHATALLFITHNLGLVAQLCRRVAVMYAGQVVELGPVSTVFDMPRHPYARGLIACIPRPDLPRSMQPASPAWGYAAPDRAGQADQGCSFAPRCPYAARECMADVALLPAGDGAVRCIRWAGLPPPPPPKMADPASTAPARPLLAVEGLNKTYRLARGLDIRANDGLRFGVARGRTLAIVGESGCGKTTFARTLMGLEDATAGVIRFDGADIARMPVRRRPPELLRALQMVFQNPDETLNPSYSVGRQVARAARLLDRGSGGVAARVAALFAATRLPLSLAGRLPRHLSGGQKQRVGIARAFAGQPALVVADEPVSALDVSVQAAVTRLLLDMQAQHGTALVVISHDLGFVRAVADDVVVMYLGRVIEAGSAADVFAPPYHPYTEALLSATPAARTAGRRVVLQGDLPSALRPPAGCAFHTRCPRRVGAVCDTEAPPEQVSADGHRILCHIPALTLAQLPPVFPAPAFPSPSRDMP